MNTAVVVKAWATVRGWIGKLRAILNTGHAAGLWPNKGKGPDVDPKG